MHAEERYTHQLDMMETVSMRLNFIGAQILLSKYCQIH